MKKIITFLAIIFITVLNLLSIEKVLIKTPFCRQPSTFDDFEEINAITWDNDEILQSIQVFLYTGGVFRVNTSGLPLEKNLGLGNYEILCMDNDPSSSNDYYIGSSHGIYKGVYSASTDKIDWEETSFLGNYYVNDLTVNDISGYKFACTTTGVWRSANDGAWEQYGDLSTTPVYKIIINGNNLYLATQKGIYKSANSGDSWNKIFPIVPIDYNKLIYTVVVNSNNFYAGTEDGLYISENGDNNWIRDNSIAGLHITAINIAGTNKYIGSLDGDFRYHNGSTWIVQNSGWSADARINSILFFDNSLWLGSEGKGLYSTSSPVGSSSSWTKKIVRENGSTKEELTIKNLYSFSNNFWLVSYGTNIYGETDVIPLLEEQKPNHSENWGNYNCHVYAWHFTEGGTISALKNFNPFIQQRYVNSDNNYSAENWDYTLASQDYRNYGWWDKVTYSTSHSGIKCSNCQFPVPYDEYDVWIISKWGENGPLVKHRLLSNPWSLNVPIRFWKSKKFISRADNEQSFSDQFISRQINTQGETIIKNGEIINFYVAPMNNHIISLTPGFHARQGSIFHAYVKDKDPLYYDDPNLPLYHEKCVIPWQKTRTQKISVNQYDFDLADLFSDKSVMKYHDSKLTFFLMPNPAVNSLKVKAKINDSDSQSLIRFDFYKLTGEKAKTIMVPNNSEKEINLDFLNNGVYLVTASASGINISGHSFDLIDSELLIINK